VCGLEREREREREREIVRESEKCVCGLEREGEVDVGPPKKCRGHQLYPKYSLQKALWVGE